VVTPDVMRGMGLVSALMKKGPEVAMTVLGILSAGNTACQP
jgi:hypothetical protein